MTVVAKTNGDPDDHINTELRMRLYANEENIGETISQITFRLHDIFDSSDILYEDIKKIVEAFIADPKRAFVFEPTNDLDSYYQMKTSLRIPMSSIHSYCYELICIKSSIEDKHKQSLFSAQWKLCI